ncbi:hypothetical protein [Curtobacterium sp. ISL-83]|uniref:hypothetical protein n=1 Tax=Curtobacterium sp. ISL-83 TaxID=2819145 RepID=UPI001BE8E7C0|nr:hypothetical protein [Curtobacterium sp. ISL-83]MBT2504251.1 hypothetical protein [Curtobacterium sp. ISL-83]
MYKRTAAALIGTLIVASSVFVATQPASAGEGNWPSAVTAGEGNWPSAVAAGEGNWPSVLASGEGNWVPEDVL